eukprot:1598652-Heterocapsa_arctica.AAC.1
MSLASVWSTSSGSSYVIDPQNKDARALAKLAKAGRAQRWGADRRAGEPHRPGHSFYKLSGPFL